MKKEPAKRKRKEQDMIFSSSLAVKDENGNEQIFSLDGPRSEWPPETIAAVEAFGEYITKLEVESFFNWLERNNLKLVLDLPLETVTSIFNAWDKHIFSVLSPTPENVRAFKEEAKAILSSRKSN